AGCPVCRYHPGVHLRPPAAAFACGQGGLVGILAGCADVPLVCNSARSQSPELRTSPREALSLTTKVASPRARTSFSRIENVLELPNLIDIQKASFQWFLDEGLRETINDISPIEDYTGTLAVEFADYVFGHPPVTIKECREKDLTYQAPLSMTVRF